MTSDSPFLSIAMSSCMKRGLNIRIKNNKIQAAKVLRNPHESSASPYISQRVTNFDNMSGYTGDYYELIFCLLGAHIIVFLASLTITAGNIKTNLSTNPFYRHYIINGPTATQMASKVSYAKIS